MSNVELKEFLSFAACLFNRFQALQLHCFSRYRSDYSAECSALHIIYRTAHLFVK